MHLVLWIKGGESFQNPERVDEVVSAELRRLMEKIMMHPQGLLRDDHHRSRRVPELPPPPRRPVRPHQGPSSSIHLLKNRQAEQPLYFVEEGLRRTPPDDTQAAWKDNALKSVIHDHILLWARTSGGGATQTFFNTASPPSRQANSSLFLARDRSDNEAYEIVRCWDGLQCVILPVKLADSVESF
ncbi:hypothetical protein E4U14_003603 [Claviceps sp. LM454 group G7]|nr:hypothetical protein E4U14_003603 [Claviceps sp. LM454 group G7]